MAVVKSWNLGRNASSPILPFSSHPTRTWEMLYIRVGIGHDLRYGWSVGVRTHWSKCGNWGRITISPILLLSHQPASQGQKMLYIKFGIGPGLRSGGSVGVRTHILFLRFSYSPGIIMQPASLLASYKPSQLPSHWTGISISLFLPFSHSPFILLIVCPFLTFSYLMKLLVFFIK